MNSANIELFSNKIQTASYYLCAVQMTIKVLSFNL